MIRIFGLLGLVLALGIVGLLVKKQMGTTVAPALPAVGGQAAPGSNPRQVQEQFKQSLDAAMQPPRQLPDDAQ